MPRVRKPLPRSAGDLGSQILGIVARELKELDRKSEGMGLEPEDVRKLETLSKVLKSVATPDAQIGTEKETITDEEIEALCLVNKP
jgi:hypothetical protein